MIRLLVALVAVLSLVFTTAPAQANTVRQKDGYNASIPAQNLKWTKYQYCNRAVYVVKVKNLSKKRTRLAVKFDRPGYSITADTKFVKGKKRVTARKSQNKAPYNSRRIKGVTAKWNFKRDTIRVVIPARHVNGRKPGMSAFTLYKGAMHGNYMGDGTYAQMRKC